MRQIPRKALAIIIATAAAVTMSSCSSPTSARTASNPSVVYVGYGGAQQDAQAKAWLAPFTKATGTKTKQETNFDNAKIKAQVDSGNVLWDVAQDFSFFVTAECGTLFQHSPQVDRSKLEPKLVTNDCGIPVSQVAAVLVYNAKAYRTAPTSWADFFDLHKFPGKRATFNAATYNLEAALLGDGVPGDKLYPLDVARAYKKLDTIKDNLIVVDSPPGVPEKVASGEADMALVFSARGYTAAQANPALTPVWNQGIFDWDNLAILKDAPHPKAAQQLLSFVAQPRQQATFASIFPYGVTTLNTQVPLNDLAKKWWVNNPANQAGRVNIDQHYWGSKYQELGDQWTTWTTS
jgi:putative spermidine/putrescine transport system substrate-binding protein